MLKAADKSVSLGLLPIASFWFLLCLSGCDVSWRDRGLDSPVGADLVERDPGGIVVSPPLAADSSSSYEHDRGGLPYLLVGLDGDRTASATIKFSALPDTLEVQAARLVLTLHAYDWEDASQRIAVAQIGYGYTDELPTITLADTMAVGHRIIHHVSWPPMNGEDELSVQLLALEGTGSCAFASSELANGPTLELEYTEGDSVRVSTFEAADDTYTLSGTQQTHGLLISQGEPARVQAYFGIERLKGSPDTTVVAATLTADNLSPHPGATVELIAYEDGELAEEVGRTTVAQSDTAFSIALSKQAVQQMQSWLERPPASDYKLLLYLQGEGLGTSWLDIDAPALTLVYSVSPTVE